MGYYVLMFFIIGFICLIIIRLSRNSTITREMRQEDKRLKSIVEGIIKPVQFDLNNKILVNGHYVKQTTIFMKVTTYFSFVILYDKLEDMLEVISYQPESGAAVSQGLFLKEQVKAIDQQGIYTNYLFYDDSGNQQFAIEAMPIVHASESDYRIDYSQLEECNELRQKFGLPSVSISSR